MSKLGNMVREAAGAALQLTLPLFDASPRVLVRPQPGRRLVRLGDEFVDYELRRSSRRTIGFSIDDRGLTVTAPRWVAQSDIDAALREKSAWIRRKLVEWRDYAKRRARLDIRWEHGADLPWLGDVLTLQVEPASRRRVERSDRVLRVGLPAQAASDSLRDSVQGWIKGEASQLFAGRIEHFAAQLGRGPSRWGLSSARTRWGSCGADGAIRLNWRLMHFPHDIIDYVIAHELAHLRELNHSPRFWATVGQLYPDYLAARAWLRGYPDDMNLG